MELTWETLEAECRSCTKCPLSETRTNCVFGTGNRNADLMFIGEAPGENEDLTGVPFVGRAGQLFDKFLYAVDIPREEVYIANMLKCRPPRNRDPQPAEQDACAEWLERQIALVNPRLIVCLGRIAAMAMIKPDFRITREHGQWFARDGRRYMAMYHPSALLRDPSKRPETFEDLVSLRQAIREACNIY